MWIATDTNASLSMSDHISNGYELRSFEYCWYLKQAKHLCVKSIKLKADF